MTTPTDTQDRLGMAVIVFESPMLPRLTTAVQNLGLEVQAFDDANEARAYITHPQTSISVVIASGTLPGVLNGADLTTTLSRAYPALPFIIADHYDGLVESNVMCLDSPWTVDEIDEQVAAMIDKLPEGKRPAA
ncbi:hypothetical protein [Pseudomonas sp. RC10]|uniref:hypothetical protein n=1 Tax=Pseudomonas bambusae TaxID=3139142 RepID=UPI0031388590